MCVLDTTHKYFTHKYYLFFPFQLCNIFLQIRLALLCLRAQVDSELVRNMTKFTKKYYEPRASLAEPCAHQRPRCSRICHKLRVVRHCHMSYLHTIINCTRVCWSWMHRPYNTTEYRYFYTHRQTYGQTDRQTEYTITASDRLPWSYGFHLELVEAVTPSRRN